MSEEEHRGSDFLSLLKLAEEIQARLESAERATAAARMVQLGVVLVGITAAVLVQINSNSVPFRSGLIVASLGVAAAYVGVIEFWLLTRLRKRVERNRRALAEVVAIVQDAAFSAMRDVSALERAEIAVRLSQFDIPRKGLRRPDRGGVDH
jgi:hypothetical protein